MCILSFEGSVLIALLVVQYVSVILVLALPQLYGIITTPSII